MKRVAGVTLIELLVALTIFALIGVMAYRAVAAAADSRTRLAAAFEQQRALGRAVARIEGDLLQIAPRATAADVPLPALKWESTERSSRITFHRMDARQGTRLVAYEHQDQRLDLLIWPNEDDTTEPRRETLLHGVTKLAWRFVVPGSKQWADSWPPPAHVAEVPAGIRLQMELAGFGPLTRTLALR